MFNSDNQYYSRSWRIVGFVATFFIIITIPLYLSVHEVSTEKSKEPHFVGRQTCIECHEAESTSWKGSHHDMAMDSANSETVLGNFDNYEFKHKGQTHRMFKKGEDFYINTLGENGKFEDFKIDYTFGYEPLQQYMVEFEGGNIQCLPIAWDTDKNKWYHLGDTLYPTEDLQANNWLFWTNQAQNWNGMCAECHSTNLKKNYDNETKTYHTTWSEIDVSCEACHGPASEHLVWAKLPENSRPTDNNTGLIVKTSNINNEEYVNDWEMLFKNPSIFIKEPSRLVCVNIGRYKSYNFSSSGIFEFIATFSISLGKKSERIFSLSCVLSIPCTCLLKEFKARVSEANRFACS